MNSIISTLIFAIVLSTSYTHAYKIDTKLNEELDKALVQENVNSFSKIMLSLPADASVMYKGEELPLYRFMLKAYPYMEKKLQTQESITSSINTFGVYTIATYLISALCLLFVKDENFPKGIAADKLAQLRVDRLEQARAFRFVLFMGSSVMLGAMGAISFFSQGSLTPTQQLKLLMQEFLEKHSLPKELSKDIKLSDYLALAMLKQAYRI